MTAILRVCCAVTLALCGPAQAAAQSLQDVNPWGHGTTLGLFAGGAASGSQVGFEAGGAIGWEVQPWFAIEGRAAWDNGIGPMDAFSGDLTARLSLRQSHPVVPFARLGMGLYHATVDPGGDDIPGFYRSRMSDERVALGISQTFTDPSFVAGAGVNFFTSRHVALRPEAQAAFVFRDGHNRTVFSFSLQVTYHFEDHPVTP
jgi:Outer membrane protein beta-barrel domain